MSVLYEKGTPAWDISSILTRHNDGSMRGQNGQRVCCARVAELQRTAGSSDARGRLRSALQLECTCGAGDSSAEQTSIRAIPGQKGVSDGAGTSALDAHGDHSPDSQTA